MKIAINIYIYILIDCNFHMYMYLAYIYIYIHAYYHIMCNISYAGKNIPRLENQNFEEAGCLEGHIEGN